MTTRRSPAAGPLAAAGTVNRAAVRSAARTRDPDQRGHRLRLSLHGAAPTPGRHLNVGPRRGGMRNGGRSSTSSPSRSSAMVAWAWWRGWAITASRPADDRGRRGRPRALFVTNRLPSTTTIHWHGQRRANGMDGVGGLNQPQIPPARPSSMSSSPAAPALHVPPARRRDGADGDGHDGLGHHPATRIPAHCAPTATSASCSTPTTSTPGSYAEDQHHARLQPVDLEQPRLPRHRPLVARRATTCACACTGT